MGLSPVALYDALYKDVGHYLVSGFNLRDSDLSYKRFVCSYLERSIIRKWIPRDSREADKNAYNKFIEANNLCKSWSLSTEMDTLSSIIIGETKKILDEFFHPGGELLVDSYFDLIKLGRPGPGVNYGSEGTCYYSKYFSSKLTSTSPYLYDEYRRYTEWIPTFSEAEQVRYENYGPPQIVKGSRCSFVPKTTAVSRMICIEPSLNMFYQLGLATILEERLRSYFRIDLKTQPLVNHRLSRLGSINGLLSTIDLSSASDSISLKLCEYILPKWFFELLLVLRSHTTEIDDEVVTLNMMSTMGCGFTFPLQTIIFSAILKAVSTICGRSDIEKTWSCFGDDLICSSFCYDRVVKTLQLFGFSINLEKSFNQGWFRESCGADWFHGQPVRPVFIKRLDRPHDYLVAINQLNEWTAYTGIALYNTVNLLFKNVGKKFLYFVPLSENNDSGIRVPSAFINPNFNRNGSFVYKANETKPTKVVIGEGSIHTPNRRKWLYNPPGLYMSFLFGELVDCTISVRHNRKLYRSRLRCSPNWDYIPTDKLTNGVNLSLQQWNTAVMRNL